MLSFKIMELAILCGLSGWLIGDILMGTEGPLYNYWKILDVLKRAYPRLELVVNPLGWCEKCLTGQIAFWSYIYCFGMNFLIIPAVAIAIFTYLITHKLLKNVI